MIISEELWVQLTVSEEWHGIGWSCRYGLVYYFGEVFV
jgi:hypothetical protein